MLPSDHRTLHGYRRYVEMVMPNEDEPETFGLHANAAAAQATAEAHDVLHTLLSLEHQDASQAASAAAAAAATGQASQAEHAPAGDDGGPTGMAGIGGSAHQLGGGARGGDGNSPMASSDPSRGGADYEVRRLVQLIKAQRNTHQMPLVREVRAILFRLPVDPCFDLELTEARYPRSYDKSLNVVLLQEIARYNGLV